MKLHDSTIEQLLVDSRTAMINALKDDPGLAPLAIYGFTKEELQRGLQMVEELERLHVKMISNYSEKESATDEKHVIWDKTRYIYKDLLEHARLLFKKDPKVISALNLDGKREKSFSDWIIQATVFYTNILKNDEIIAKFATFSITKEQILEGQSMLKALNEAHAKREEDIGTAEEATLLRDGAREDLVEFMDDFIDAAVLALKNTPQQMEKLGIVVKR